MWWRTLVLSLSGILGAIGVLGGFDAHHFPAYFEDVGALVVMFLGIPIVLVTLALIGFEKFLGRYGRAVVTLICAAPGLCLYGLFLFGGGGDAGYALTIVACFSGWAVLWFITAPQAYPARSDRGAS
jgi:hypothetical protein